ncbi:uncharacterized protein LY79DRAFT_83392 [Colletotrichum navitas]|uniref:Uncharacterized protein n=1 Tax=Colletotrichum navitas TaxID=681940 RepID=A0AAD8V6M1_9PEZI|nr:uncharacterized protein LY79DRAFT_83392 [Colletotrichum navitas]KAK1596192.1 hypothetical protein LY79DRAFT_83392 [Colletotrichum navitas]
MLQMGFELASHLQHTYLYTYLPRLQARSRQSRRSPPSPPAFSTSAVRPDSRVFSVFLALHGPYNRPPGVDLGNYPRAVHSRSLPYSSSFLAHLTVQHLPTSPALPHRTLLALPYTAPFRPLFTRPPSSPSDLSSPSSSTSSSLTPRSADETRTKTSFPLALGIQKPGALPKRSHHPTSAST